jgi:hypothetical protein
MACVGTDPGTLGAVGVTATMAATGTAPGYLAVTGVDG